MFDSSRRFRRRGWRGGKARMRMRMNIRSYKKYYQRNWASSSHNVWVTQRLQTDLMLKAYKVFHVKAARHMQFVWTGHLVNHCKEEETICWLNIEFNWQLHLSKVTITFLKTSCFIQWRLRELLTPITNAVKKLPSPSAISIATMHRFSNFSPISIGGQLTWS